MTLEHISGTEFQFQNFGGIRAVEQEIWLEGLGEGTLKAAFAWHFP